jgi:hypothetical protein
MVGWEMMGAGSDPLKKHQDYARLTGDLKGLMETKFDFPKTSAARHLPIIDVFSRTLACPIATQRQNPLVAARIGSNLSLLTQSLSIKPEGIKWIVSSSDTLDKRKKREKIVILTDLEEYKARTNTPISAENKRLLGIKEENYYRYNKLFIMIEDKNIVEPANEQFAYILTLIDRKYEDDSFG